MEKSFRNRREAIVAARAAATESVARAWFADQLRAAFPEARSVNELAEIAAVVLSGADRRVDPRTVRNWIAGENAPSFRYVLPVLALAGTERAMALLDRTGGR